MALSGLKLVKVFYTSKYRLIHQRCAETVKFLNLSADFTTTAYNYITLLNGVTSQVLIELKDSYWMGQLL